MKFRFLLFGTFLLFAFWSMFSFLPAHGQILNVQRNINLQSKSLYNVDSIGVSTTTIVSSTIILGSGGIIFPDGTTQITAPGGTVTMSAGNVSSGAFGLNTGGGVFSFPTNVGIGTTTPGALLDVNNGTFGTKLTGMSVNFTRSTGPSYLWAEAVGGYIDLVTNGRPNSDANSNLVLKPDQNSYFNGSVGIATTTPAQKLVVVGNIKIDTAGNGIIFPDGTKQVSAATSGASTVSAGNVSAGAFGSNTGGGNYTFPAKISVGTTTAPVQAIDIFSGGRVRVRDSGANSGEFFTGVSGGLTATHIGSVSNIPIAFFANSSAPLMTITPAGNVGIGTTAPFATLSVNKPGSSALFGGLPPAIYAESINSASYGIVGSSPNGGNGIGVGGFGSTGVSGVGTTTVAGSIGLSGSATGPGGFGVKATGGLSAGGYAFWGQGDSGVYGLAIGAGKPGVYGEGEKGVIASSTSAAGYDLYAAGQGENYFKNNVGIGISNPSSALGVALGGIAVGNNYSQSAVISAGNVAIENGLTVGTTTNSGLVTFASNVDPHVYIIGPSNYSTLNFVTKGTPATADIGLALGDLSITNNTVGGDINIFAGTSATTTISGDYINLSTGGVGGGVRINTLGTKPTCNAQHRGVMWYTWGAGSFPSDAFEVCAPVSGTYAWHTLF